MSLDRLWAGWRSPYVSDPRTGSEDEGCVLCRLVDTDDDLEALVLERTESTIVVMNLYPYTNGHVMVSPSRHTPDLDDLTDDEATELMAAMRRAVRAVKAVYSPGGLNLGVNQRAPAGAGVPGHLHVHVLPRWSGDTNFMTSVAEVRVMPEDIRTSYRRLRDAWPP